MITKRMYIWNKAPNSWIRTDYLFLNILVYRFEDLILTNGIKTSGV